MLGRPPRAAALVDPHVRVPGQPRPVDHHERQPAVERGLDARVRGRHRAHGERADDGVAHALAALRHEQQREPGGLDGARDAAQQQRRRRGPRTPAQRRPRASARRRRYDPSAAAARPDPARRSPARRPWRGSARAAPARAGRGGCTRWRRVVRETPTASAIVFSVTRAGVTTPPAARASRRSRRDTGRRRSTAIRAVRTRIRRSSRSEACSRYQRSSSIRSCHGSEARPFTCAQPVMPGARVEPHPLALAVAVDLHLHGRPRADQRHLAAQHVHQVRQLVERRAPQPRAEPRDPVVALVDREALAHPLGAAHHRAQLVQLERPAVTADPALAVDRVAVRLEPDRERRQRQQRAGQRQHAAADHDVERALAPRAQVRHRAHRVPSGASQPTSVPWRSQSYSPAASAAVVST